MDLVSILECVAAGLLSDEDVGELLLDAIKKAGREPTVLGRRDSAEDKPPPGIMEEEEAEEKIPVDEDGQGANLVDDDDAGIEVNEIDPVQRGLSEMARRDDGPAIPRPPPGVVPRDPRLVSDKRSFAMRRLRAKKRRIQRE